MRNVWQVIASTLSYRLIGKPGAFMVQRKKDDDWHNLDGISSTTAGGLRLLADALEAPQGIRLFYYESDRGARIIKGTDLADARRYANMEIGSMDSIRCIREATENDVAWHKTMGGRVPEL